MSQNRIIPNRQSLRLKGYDYSQAGAYFVTICCYDCLSSFGKVVHNEMDLKEYGQIAYNQ